MAPLRDDFGAVRPIRRINRFTQAILAITLAVVVNYLSLTQFRTRVDLTPDHRHSLAPESAETVRVAGRKSPLGQGRNQAWVKAVVLDNDAAISDPSTRESHKELRQLLLKLLDAYAVESGKQGSAWFSIENAGGGRNAPLLSEIASQHGAPDLNTALILTCGSRAKYISYRELVSVTPDNQFNGFRGEEVITSALIEITEDKPAICYVTHGHGEMLPDDTSPARGMSLLSRQLRSRNFQIKALDLATVSEIPRDASMVLIAGPVTPFSAVENSRIKNYLYEHNGRVLALLDVGRDHGLEPVLSDWGIFCPDAELEEPDPASRATDGDIALRRFDAKVHPLTKVLQEQNLPLIVGKVRPAKFDEGSAPDSTLGVWQLIFSSPVAWGQVNRTKHQTQADAAHDQIGPVCLAVAAERATGIRKGTGSNGGRLVVIGTSEIAANARFNRGGNRAFTSQCCAWLSDRDRAVSLPSRAVGEYQLNATSRDFIDLAIRFACVPFIILAVGLAISVWRRRT
jgi:hypothetical protein